MNYEMGKTKIANYALNIIGKEMVNSIEQDTESARQINEYYDIVLKRILSEYDWNFARRTIDIFEVVPGDDYKNYDYAFGLPANYVAARRVRPEQYYEIYDNDTLRCNNPAERVVEVVDPEDSNKSIEATQRYMELTYTKSDIDPMKMNPAFFQYFAASLAQEVAFFLTGDMNVMQMALTLANSYQAIAHVEDASISRYQEYGEKPFWYRNHKEYYARRYRDGGPNATEDFLK